MFRPIPLLLSKQHCKALFIIFCLLLLPHFINAQTYVANGGTDGPGFGTVGSPYKTIKYAVDHPIAGSPVVNIKPGFYPETDEIQITSSKRLQKSGTGEVIIDAYNRNITTPFKLIISIVNTSNVVIDGLTLQNCIGNGCKGIFILGSGGNDTIKNCKIRNIGWVEGLTTLPPFNSGIGANAIRVQGTINATPLSSIFIKNDTVTNCATGYGEAITIAGNVDGFTIENNVVDSIANIGIVAAGHHETFVSPAVNQPRNGIIIGNTVSRCMSGIRTSAGIYIDGAINCLVEKNKCFRNGTGISVGAEVILPAGASPASGNIVRNNLVYDNSVSGIFLGSGTPGNLVKNSSIANNTIYKNCTGETVNGITTIDGMPVGNVATGVGADVALFNSDNFIFQNNIIYPGITRSAVVGMSGNTSVSFTSNYNLYYHDDASPLFNFNTGHNFNGHSNLTAYSTISAFTAATTQETNSLYGNPQFVSAAARNFLLGFCSFAINKGNPVASNYSATDFGGFTRVVNGRIDCGAYEYQSAVTPCPFSLRAPVAQCNGTTSRIILSWTPSVHASSYSVYRNSTLLQSGITDTLSADNTVTASVSYQYLIKADNIVDNSNGNQPVVALNCAITAIQDPVNNPFEIKILPTISASGEFFVTAKKTAGKNIQIDLVNGMGQIIYSTSQKSLSNDFLYKLELNDIARGIYFIQLRIDKVSFLEKITRQ